MLTPIIKSKIHSCPHCQENLISFEERKIKNINGKSIFNKSYLFEKDESEEDFISYKREDIVKRNNSLDLIYILEGHCPKCDKTLYSAQHWFSLNYKKHYLDILMNNSEEFLNIEMDGIVLSYKEEDDGILFKVYHDIYDNKEELISDIIDYDSNIFLTAKNYMEEFEIIESFKISELEASEKELIKNILNSNEENIICHISGEEKYDILEFSPLSETYIDIFKYLLAQSISLNKEDYSYYVTYNEPVNDNDFIKNITDVFGEKISNLQIEIPILY